MLAVFLPHLSIQGPGSANQLNTCLALMDMKLEDRFKVKPVSNCL